jgi:hypothetical protein
MIYGGTAQSTAAYKYEYWRKYARCDPSHERPIADPEFSVENVLNCHDQDYNPCSWATSVSTPLRSHAPSRK